MLFTAPRGTHAIALQSRPVSLRVTCVMEGSRSSRDTADCTTPAPALPRLRTPPRDPPPLFHSLLRCSASRSERLSHRRTPRCARADRCQILSICSLALSPLLSTVQLQSAPRVHSRLEQSPLARARSLLLRQQRSRSSHQQQRWVVVPPQMLQRHSPSCPRRRRPQAAAGVEARAQRRAASLTLALHQAPAQALAQLHQTLVQRHLIQLQRLLHVRVPLPPPLRIPLLHPRAHRADTQPAPPRSPLATAWRSPLLMLRRSHRGCRNRTRRPLES